MAEAPDMTDPGVRARMALAVLAVAGPAVGGLWLRARPSPVREAFLATLDRLLPEVARIGPETEDFALSGGVDVGASLATGQRVMAPGLLVRRGRFTLASAERASPALAARLAQALDRGDRALVALDEGAEPEEALPPGLAARLGLFIDLDGLGMRDKAAVSEPPIGLDGARATWRDTAFCAELETVLAEYGAFLGISEARHLLATRAAARCLAALRGAREAGREDLDTAAALVLVPRGHVPDMQSEVDQPEPEKRDEQPSERDGDTSAEGGAVEDRVTGAEAVPLPAALLDLSATAPGRGAHGAGAGAALKGTNRGRPLPSRPGHASARARIDPVATLRAAIPWQRLRPPSPRGQPVALRPSDIRIRRFEERSDRVVIFAVDASGSQAMARMAEAKGAVECLLSEAYRRRDQVAMVAFRGREADVLLAPTRALVRARNALIALPAGGATPLAAGLGAASVLALQARSAGATPVVVLLSDGKANIALDGQADRTRAAEDALAAARRLATTGIECLVLDTGRRPQAALEALAQSLRARYLALPFGGAREMSAAVSAALDG